MVDIVLAIFVLALPALAIAIDAVVVIAWVRGQFR
jgi:hypothetical protein